MARDRGEERELMQAFRGWLGDRPTAGMICGTVELGAPEDGARVDLGTVDFTSTHLVAAADALLERAAERMAAMAQDDETRALIAKIEQARTALDFCDPAGPVS